MCGLVGIYSMDGRPLPGPEVIRRMAGTISHRGPDDEGFYEDGRIALGFRRLSIIDLETGSQPLSNEDGRVWTVFNGEIYNHAELRRDLEAQGHRFATKTDTEVLVHLYEEFGDGFVERLRGMFSFCIWDKAKGRALLARDRLGIKPLYYALADGLLFFASEIKALLASGLVPRDADAAALSHFLGLQYVPAPLTIYKAVRKLQPGHRLTAGGPGASRPDEARYWDLARVAPHGMSEPEARERYAELIRDSVRVHLRSDVPLGAFLSGGVDSASVVATMAELGAGPINTFTITHADAAYDESSLAELVARRYGTNHRTLEVGPKDFLALIPSLLEAYDEPFADASALPTFLVSRFAREHVTVALSGDGGDETCAGYARYALEARLAKAARALPLSRLMPGAFKDWLRPRAYAKAGAASTAAKVAFNLASTPAQRHLFFMSYFRDGKRSLYDPSFLASSPVDDDLRLFEGVMGRIPPGDPLRALLYLDQTTYLPDDILTKVDIASMANSLEVRVPLLDHQIVEFLAATPSAFKLSGGEGKKIFKEVVREKLPPELLGRRKRGFEIPVSSWFRNELAQTVRDILLDSALLRPPHFDRGMVEKMVTDHASGRQDMGPQLWTLLALAVWHAKSRARFGAS